MTAGHPREARLPRGRNELKRVKILLRKVKISRNGLEVGVLDVEEGDFVKTEFTLISLEEGEVVTRYP